MTTSLINEFNAAVCINQKEINKAFDKSFKETDDLPKVWDIKQGSKWSILANLKAPSIDFSTTKKNGCRLIIPIETGEMKYRYINDDVDPPVIEYKTVKLDNLSISLDVAMKGIKHKAGDGETVDKNFTVQSLYADMNDPTLEIRIDTSKAIDVDINDVKTRLSDYLTNYFKNEGSKFKYVIGKSKIPNVEQTKGDLAPTGVQFSTYNNQGNQCLNWNLLTHKVDFPKGANAGAFDKFPLSKEQNGVLFISWNDLMSYIMSKCFTSFGVEPSDFILTEVNNIPTLTLKSDKKWTIGGYEDSEFNTANFKRITCTPEVDENRIHIKYSMRDLKKKVRKIDHDIYFSLSETYQQQMIMWQSSGSKGTQPFPPIPPKDSHPYKVDWDGYLSFKIEGGKLSGSYSQTSKKDMKIERQDGKSFLEYLEAIGTLGLSLLFDLFNNLPDQLASTITKTASDTNISHTIDAVELPGKSVFKFSKCSVTDLGLKIELVYQ